MIKKKEPKRSLDTANAEDFLQAAEADIFSGIPVIIDDKPITLKKQICESILDEMEALEEVVKATKKKLDSLSAKFFVLKNGDPLGGSYSIRFDKDNEIKNEGEMESILFNRFIETYSLDIKDIFDKIEETVELLKYMSKDKRDRYCEVDIFALEKKEPVEC